RHTRFDCDWSSDVCSSDLAKEPSPSELKNKIVARKSIHLKHALKKAHKLTAGDLEMKRPGDGISPMRMAEIIGKCILTDLPKERSEERRVGKESRRQNALE